VQSIGLDIVSTDRIRKAYADHGERFARRILGPKELEVFDRRVDKVEYIAGRFAAKEAVIKALGRFLRDRPKFDSLQIVNDDTGQPVVIFPPDVIAVLAGHRCLLSISHEKTNTAAVAVFVEDK